MNDDEQRVEDRPASEQEDEPTQASGAGESGDGGDEPSAQERAEQVAEEEEKAKEEIRELEQKDADELPEKPEDWPSGKAKYETFGGPEGQHAYDEGPEKKLGPSSLRHHEGGDTVTVEGEEVDDADQYKGDPVPGGPTDEQSPDDPGEHGKVEDDDEETGGPQGSSDGEGDDADEDESER